MTKWLKMKPSSKTRTKWFKQTKYKKQKNIFEINQY